MQWQHLHNLKLMLKVDVYFYQQKNTRNLSTRDSGHAGPHAEIFHQGGGGVIQTLK
jgi:hypothetical protein